VEKTAEETLRAEVDDDRLLISCSAVMRRVWQMIERVAPSDVSVLITGPTGTGKELVARVIHKQSPRAQRDFLALDCTAVSPALLESELFGHERGAFTGADRDRVGMFELADGATLLLDEIANLSLEAQAKLLRVLQEREFRRIGGRRMIRTDFRLISASNADLAACVRAGSFRGDLYHRLKVSHIELPALATRREDIPLLTSHFIDRKRLRLKRPWVCRVSHQALDVLMAYDWPGNVRELENVIEAAILECTGDTIEASHLVVSPGMPAAAFGVDALSLPYREARQQALVTFERLYLLALLRQHHGRVQPIASQAGVTPKHIRTLLRRHGISRREFRRPQMRRGVLMRARGPRQR
jgi:DNA-binding NtrC family response regulator